MKKDLKYYRENAEEDYLTTPISVLRYIGLAERRISVLGSIIVVLLFICFFSLIGGIYIGQKSKQTEIENRANEVLKRSVNKIEKDCYTNEDIEIILFNETQL